MKTIFKNEKKMLCIMMTLITLTFLGNVSIPVTHATDAVPEVFVDPENSIFTTAQKHVNDTFTINVTIANMTGLCGFEFKLYWNSSLLNGVSMTENLFAAVTPSSEVDNIWKLKHEVAADHVWYAYTYMDLSRAIAGGYAPINITTDNYPEGKLAAAIITLKIIAEPTTPETFLESILDVTVSKPGDITGTLITHQVVNGYYKLSAPPLPTPLLKVEPEVYEVTNKNEVFDVNITINNLDAGLKVVGAEFKLRYNPALLTIVNVTEGPFMKFFAQPPDQGTLFMGPVYGSDYVHIGILILPDENGTWHEPFPSGNGTLATITFNVTKGPAVSCDLELFDTKLGDTNAQPVTHTTQDGIFTFNIEILYHNIMVNDQSFIVISESNASISPTPMIIYSRQRMLTFNATGEDGAVCFVNVTIPKNLIWLELPADNWIVLVGGFEVPVISGGNETHTWIYFTFTTSLKTVYIIGTGAIPEFPTLTILTSLIASVIIIFLSRRMMHRKSKAVSF
jgi:hypothetical protein